MELVVAVISLIWVIGILTLQRLDVVIDEFVKADAYYLSLEQNGAIDQTQLSVKSLLPATAITHLVRQLSTSPHRWDREGLKKSVRFYKISGRVKGGLESTLIAITLALPTIYLIDFSSYNFPTYASKSLLMYSLFFLAVVISLAAKRLLVFCSKRLYPLKVTVPSE